MRNWFLQSNLEVLEDLLAILVEDLCHWREHWGDASRQAVSLPWSTSSMIPLPKQVESAEIIQISVCMEDRCDIFGEHLQTESALGAIIV
jgi:hypothetical protein